MTKRKNQVDPDAQGNVPVQEIENDEPSFFVDLTEATEEPAASEEATEVVLIGDSQLVPHLEMREYIGKSLDEFTWDVVRSPEGSTFYGDETPLAPETIITEELIKTYKRIVVIPPTGEKG